MTRPLLLTLLFFIFFLLSLFLEVGSTIRELAIWLMAKWLNTARLFIFHQGIAIFAICRFER